VPRKARLATDPHRRTQTIFLAIQAQEMEYIAKFKKMGVPILSKRKIDEPANPDLQNSKTLDKERKNE